VPTIIRENFTVSTTLRFQDSVQISAGVTVTVQPGASIDLGGHSLLNYGTLKLQGSATDFAGLANGKYSTKDTRGVLLSNFGLLETVDVDGFFSNGSVQLTNTVVKGSSVDALAETYVTDSLFMNSDLDIGIEPATVLRSTFLASPIRALAWSDIQTRSFESVNFLQMRTVFELDDFFTGGSHAVSIRNSYIDLAADESIDDRVFDADDSRSVLTNITPGAFNSSPFTNDPNGFRVGADLVPWESLGYEHTTQSPLVQFAVVSSAANEGNSDNTTITLQWALSAASRQVISVPLSFSGTATSGVDYSPSSARITIAAGQTSGTTSFSVYGDTLAERNETVVVTMGSPINASLGENTRFTHTILNEDRITSPSNGTTIPIVEFATTSGASNEGRDGVDPIIVAIKLSAPVEQFVTVPISYSGNALRGTDYLPHSTIIPTFTGRPFDLAIHGNGFFEIHLPDGSTAYTREGRLTLDEQRQLVTVSGHVLAPGITIPDQATNIQINEFGQISVMVNEALAQLGQLQLSDFVNPNGLSVMGENLYVETESSGPPLTGTPGLAGIGSIMHGFANTNLQSLGITIRPGETTGYVILPVIGDEIVESDEIIVMTLGAAANASLGPRSTFTYTVLNDDGTMLPNSRTSSLTVLVDKGILGVSPILVKDLVEEISSDGTTVLSHTLSYQGTRLNYDAIDGVIMTVLRDGEFTEEFRKEITAQYPSFNGIKYKETVDLVGTAAIDSILISIAGADGNYVN
jgi:hypothetical protein